MRRSTVKPNSWEFCLLENVGRFWEEVRTVPMRAEGRKHHHEEQYAVGLYLLLLGRDGLLSYPFKLYEGESPDFILTWPSTETSGLEVTRATTQRFQKVMSDIDREYVRREKKAKAKGIEAQPVGVIYNPLGWTDGQCVQNWPDQVLEAIIRKPDKLAKFRRAAHHDLLICKVIEPRPHPTSTPAIEITLHRGVGRKLLRQQTPLAAGLGQIEYRIDHRTQRRCTGPASLGRWGKLSCDYRPFVVCVSLA